LDLRSGGSRCRLALRDLGRRRLDGRFHRGGAFGRICLFVSAELVATGDSPGERPHRKSAAAAAAAEAREPEDQLAIIVRRTACVGNPLPTDRVEPVVRRLALTAPAFEPVAPEAR